MFGALLIAATLAGQSMPTPYNPTVAGHVFTDPEGRSWTGPDPVWLSRWVSPAYKAGRDAKWPLAGPVSPPTVPPTGPTPPPSDPSVPLDYGVDYSRLPKHDAEGVWYGGNVPAASEAQMPGVYLTVIAASKDEAKGVLDRWGADPEFAKVRAEYGDTLAVHAFSSDNPIVSQVKLPAGGKPDVVIQDGKGKVLYRTGSDPGPQVIAGELRKADPRYDPGKDPAGGVASYLSGETGTYVAIAVGLVTFILIGSRRP